MFSLLVMENSSGFPSAYTDPCASGSCSTRVREPAQLSGPQLPHLSEQLDLAAETLLVLKL